jgi:hypothetical protein
MATNLIACGVVEGMFVERDEHGAPSNILFDMRAVLEPLVQEPTECGSLGGLIRSEVGWPVILGNRIITNGDTKQPLIRQNTSFRVGSKFDLALGLRTWIIGSEGQCLSAHGH